MRIRNFIALLALIPLIAGAWQLQPSAFHISIIDGEGALNNVQGRLAREPVIQVEDRNHRRIPGAYVVFDSPKSGPSAVFADGSNHFAATTGADGRAAATGMRPNNVNGSFNIDVHVFVQGQEIGHVTIHQSNVPPKVDQIANNLQPSNANRTGEVGAAAAAGALGIALADEFSVNGAPVHGNANLQNGTEVSAGAKPVVLYLHNHGEFLIGPNSSVLLSEPNSLIIETGAARARQFGSWRMGHAGVWVVGVGDDADGVISISPGSVEVASINGTVNIVDEAGKVLKTLKSGLVFVFPITPVVSGAGVGATGISAGHILLIGAAAAAGLVGLGTALDLNSSTPPTSQ
ncbi:MAG TPA: hypothetical protein VHZ07_24345 [Bryobacteraceae bacterium]|jgi:hypothetical protein|nr:hypothetical protein [Bryobacteraceae bacterium]